MATKNKPKNSSKSSGNGQIDPRDVFQTPPYALDVLLPYLRRAKVQSVWESAAGQGYLACWLAQAGFDVYATDLATGHDRFAMQVEQIDAEVTNVPFSLKPEWIERACSQSDRVVALLMPSDALFSGEKIWPLIDRYNLQFLIPKQRIDYKAPNAGWIESSAQMNTGWCTRGLNLPETFNRCYLNKPKRKDLRILAPIWDAQHAEYMRSVGSHVQTVESQSALEWVIA